MSIQSVCIPFLVKCNHVQVIPSFCVNFVVGGGGGGVLLLMLLFVCLFVCFVVVFCTVLSHFLCVCV